MKGILSYLTHENHKEYIYRRNSRVSWIYFEIELWLMPSPIVVTWIPVILGFFCLSFNISSLFYIFYSMEFSYKVRTSIAFPFSLLFVKRVKSRCDFVTSAKDSPANSVILWLKTFLAALPTHSKAECANLPLGLQYINLI